MSVFPQYATISYNSPFSPSIGFKTLTQEFESGILTRKQKRTYPRRNFNINYKSLTSASVSDLITLYQFFIARAGMLEDFVIFDKHTNYEYVKEYVGTGDGSTVEFNLPSLNASSYTLYVDDVAQVEGDSSAADWDFGQADGDDGEDTATFATAPADGERITFSFTGRLKVRAIFGADEMSWDEFFENITHMGIPIRGLLNT